MINETLNIVEVGPRDGFQSIVEPIPTGVKIALIEALYDAGIRRMEATAFVSPKAVPQLADAAEVLRAANTLAGLDVQVLVPNLSNANRAIEAGARHVAFVLSVSERHNRNNVKRSPAESVREYAAIVDRLPPGTKVRLNVATAFDCPFDGEVVADATLELIATLAPIYPDAEICMCDTTGRVTPDRVRRLFESARDRFPAHRGWAYHGHDTFGLGVANAIAAWEAGVRVMDASFAGLGGCPFAPGATGNVATEDVVWTFSQMGISSGVDLDKLLSAARRAAAIPTALHGGRVRSALDARLCLDRLSP